MVCPSCLNNDDDKFSEIKGCFMAETGHGWDKHHSEVSIYACQKCSALMVSGGWQFDQKSVPAAGN